MTTALEAETLHPKRHTSAAPDPDWVRGKCPICGAPTVQNTYYIGGRGDVAQLECWNSLGPQEGRTCEYRIRSTGAIPKVTRLPREENTS